MKPALPPSKRVSDVVGIDQEALNSSNFHRHFKIWYSKVSLSSIHHFMVICEKNYNKSREILARILPLLLFCYLQAIPVKIGVILASKPVYGRGYHSYDCVVTKTKVVMMAPRVSSLPSSPLGHSVSLQDLLFARLILTHA